MLRLSVTGVVPRRDAAPARRAAEWPEAPPVACDDIEYAPVTRLGMTTLEGGAAVRILL